MLTSMKADGIRQAVRRRPFRPFYLHMADGRQVLVRHPEMIVVTSDDRSVFVDVPDGDNYLDTVLITALEYRKKARRA